MKRSARLVMPDPPERVAPNNPANSYFGLLSQASHSEKDREKLARVVLLRGNSVNAELTKTYQRREAVRCKQDRAIAQDQQST